MNNIYLREKRCQKLYKFIDRHNSKLVWGLVTFIVPIITKIGDYIVDEKSLLEFFKQTQFYIFSIGIILYMFIKIFQWILYKYLTSKRKIKEFKELSKKYTNPIFNGIESNEIGWSWDRNFISYKNIQKGLPTTHVRFEKNRLQFEMNEMLEMGIEEFEGRNLQEEYEEYKQNEYFKHFAYDSTRLMLRQKPKYDSTNNTLTIYFKETTWSQYRFVRDVLLKDNYELTKKIIEYSYNNNDIKIPNTLSLHLVVQTQDDKILIVQNSPNKVTDYPLSWTVSISENLDLKDFTNIESDTAYRFVERALLEELALTQMDYQKENIKYLSLNCEGNVCNFTYACLIKINMTSEELTTHLYEDQRMDNEFNKFEFLEIDDIPKELVSPARYYHPSSPIRMLYTYWNLRGVSEIKYEDYQKQIKENEISKNEY